MMRWRLKDGLWVAACILLFGQATAIEVALEYYRFPDDAEQTGFVPYGYGSPEKSKEPPPGDWKLPELKGSLPVYALVPLGDQEHLMVLDAKNADAKFYDRIYFDANANRDLTDDPVIRPSADGSTENELNYVPFESVEAEIALGNKKLPYSFQPTVYCFYNNLTNRDLANDLNWRNLHVQLRLNCAYKGQIEIGGSKYKVTLADYNVNGRFDDTYSEKTIATTSGGAIYPMGDRIYLSQGEDIDYYDGFVLCSHLYLGGECFAMTVDTSKDRMTLEARTDGLGTIAVPSEIERVALEGKDRGVSFLAYKPAGKIRVPAGSYRLLSYQTYLTAKQGDRWRLMAGGTQDAAFISLGAQQEATLKIGEPYTPQVRLPEYFSEMLITERGVEEARLEFLVRGAGDEVVTELSRVSGKNSDIEMSKKSSAQPKEPTYKIIQADGEVVAQGSFEYG